MPADRWRFDSEWAFRPALSLSPRVVYARVVGAALKQRLLELQEKYEVIGDVRGRGLMLAIELVRDRETREPLVPFAAKGEAAAPMSAMMKAGMENGLYLSFFSNVIRLTPPLNITEEDLIHTRI